MVEKVAMNMMRCLTTNYLIIHYSTNMLKIDGAHAIKINGSLYTDITDVYHKFYA